MTACGSAESVDQIPVFVQPYYEAASSPRGRPQVAVGRDFDELLSSNRRSDITSARGMIEANPDMITPMTFMVLAIRLYDVGLRDEAVFWFYVAKDRFQTLADVLVVESPALAQPAQAVVAFNSLAGPFINGYAFCDLDNQRQLRREALEWVEHTPYQALFMSQLPARPGDRGANLRRSIAEIRKAVEEEERYLADPGNLAEFRRIRAENRADEIFCLK